MKRIIVILTLLLMIVTGCSSATAKDEFENADTYYAYMLFISDENMNMEHFYPAKNQNLVNSKLLISNDRVKLEWIEGEELKGTVTGTRTINEEGDDMDIYDLSVDNSEVTASLVVSKEEGQIESVQYMVKNGDYWTSFMFKKEKAELGETTGHYCTLTSDGMILDSQHKDKDSFTSTETYQKIKESFETLFGEESVTEVTFDDHDNVLYLKQFMPDGTAYAIYSKNQKVLDSWKKVTDGLQEIVGKYKAICQLAKYREVEPVIFIMNDEDHDKVLFACKDDKVLYNATTDADFVSKKATVNTDSATNITESFTNKYGTSTTKCHHSGCNNYIARSGDTWDCEKHANKCGKCGKYIDCDAMYCMDCIEGALSNNSSNSSNQSFTNKYGTSTTKCHHAGCNNYIARSGDTWDCEAHANKCLNCRKYIDCDAVYCMDCISNSLNGN